MRVCVSVNRPQERQIKDKNLLTLKIRKNHRETCVADRGVLGSRLRESRVSLIVSMRNVNRSLKSSVDTLFHTLTVSVPLTTSICGHPCILL